MFHLHRRIKNAVHVHITYPRFLIRMAFKNKITKWIQKDWFTALFLLIIYLAIKGYKYGWDDQHVEIPLLKSLIDHTLYRGDYYVESLKSNFVTYFYPLLAHLITVKQIPTAYFILYLTSRYFFLFWIYKLWYFVSKQKSVAFICTIVFILFGRVPEFLYRTFSHQEFALAIIFAGIYLFYKERFVLAALVLGIAANFHLLYSLFPMAYLSVYLLFNWRRHGFKTIIKSFLAFLIFVSPLLLWIIKKNLPAYLNNLSSSPINWIALYKIACLQNFIFFGITLKYMLTNFKIWWGVTQSYILLVALYILNALHNEKFRSDRKGHIIFLTVLGLLVFTYFFTYTKPNRFIIDLNLVRNTQFLFFFLMGYTTILVMKLIDSEKILLGYCATIFFGLLVLNDCLAILSTLSLTLLLSLRNVYKSPKKIVRNILIIGICTGLLFCTAAALWLIFKSDRVVKIVISSLIGTATFSYIVIRYIKTQKHNLFLKRLLIIIPLVALSAYYAYYHFTRFNIETKGGGYWKLQRDWEDMQRFVQTSTPKDAAFLVPHDMEMGGFRIYSERKIICCYRDCGIIGFDYNAAVEWLKRLNDVEPFKVVIDSDIKPAIVKAIIKYKVDYIVFMRYYAPREGSVGLYQKVYENDSFSLFKSKANMALRPT